MFPMPSSFVTPPSPSSLHMSDLTALFDAAPVSLWLEDFSGIRLELQALRAQGVTDFAAHLASHPEFVDACLARIKVLAVNAYTLRLFGAATQDILLANLHCVFQGDTRSHFAGDLMRMWEGKIEIETEGVNYALDGQPIDILMRRSALPGHEQDWARTLVSLMDIRERKRAERERDAMQAYSRGLFEHSPVSLWVEDFSGVRKMLDDLRASGVKHIATYLRQTPDFVRRCIREIKVLDVNARTLKLFQAESKQHLLDNLDKIFQRDVVKHFTDDLIEMANGRIEYECEGINYSLTGEHIDIHLQRSAMPGYETSWERVLISLSDITARKRAEAYMKYLGTHDAMTGLLNRASYEEAIQNVERENPDSAVLAIFDLNGLKLANDGLGHAAGDMLIRRAGEVLKEVSQQGDIVARIGGDEFAMLMPGRDMDYAERLVEKLQRLVEVNNQFYQGPALSIAIGCAQAGGEFSIREAERLADQAMYENKGAQRRV